MSRSNGRAADEMREHEIILNFVPTADGSCLIRTGNTRVICTASVDEGVPPFLRGQGEGWVTAEYAMLPASTGHRKARDGVKKDGRGVEIGRLIGRALRQAVDRRFLGDRTITIDCDVLTADGGTRTAAITGGFVALCLAVKKLMDAGKLTESPINTQIAAVSAGVVAGVPSLDLDYQEDSTAGTDMNFVMNGAGDFVEVQGTGEGKAFTREELNQLLDLGEKGCHALLQLQRNALGSMADMIGQKRTLILATNNSHKVSELRAMIGGNVRVLSMREAGVTEEIPETGETFMENALIKARYVAKKTGFTALADDSGLMVDALGGAPGVYSARYAGEHGNDAANNILLINNLFTKPKPWHAKFVCAMALVSPYGKEATEQGEVAGEIIEESRGENGFGYDPHFLYQTGETFAQMSAEDKNVVSHRARAMQKMLPHLKTL